MRSFRRLSRLLALISWSALIFIMASPWLLKKDKRADKKIQKINFLWAKGLARIAGLRTTIKGSPPPSSGGLVISNHLGYFDIVTHGSVISSRFTPKSDIRSWPVIGWYIGLSRPVWVNRRSKRASERTLAEFIASMREGYFLVAYPEGTSTDGKNGILPFKSTPFEAAIRSGAPIYPIITRYKDIPGSPEITWYGDMKFLPHLWDLLGTRSIEAELTFLEPVNPLGMSRKELAAHIHGIMTKHMRSFS